jgi:hypothetical protein
MNRTLYVSLSLTSSSSDEELSSLVQRIFLKFCFLVPFSLYICLLLESYSSFLFFLLWVYFLEKLPIPSQLKKINEILPLYLLVPFFILLMKLAASSSSSETSLQLLFDFSFCLFFFICLLRFFECCFFCNWIVLLYSHLKKCECPMELIHGHCS